MPDVSVTAPEYASRRRLTADERRARILDAARTEFARAGYHGASTASIAKAAGCSEPMLYKHFVGKHALFVAVLEHVSGIIEEGFDRVLNAPGDLLDNLRGFLPLVMDDPAYVESLQLRKLAVTLVHEPAVHGMLLDLQQRHEARVHHAIERAQAEGLVREDVRAEDVAWTWTGLMLAGCYREALGPGGFAAMLPTVEDFIERLRR
jgi:AcrR family transcriptional regulator